MNDHVCGFGRALGAAGSAEHSGAGGFGAGDHPVAAGACDGRTATGAEATSAPGLSPSGARNPTGRSRLRPLSRLAAGLFALLAGAVLLAPEKAYAQDPFGPPR